MISINKVCNLRYPAGLLTCFCVFVSVSAQNETDTSSFMNNTTCSEHEESSEFPEDLFSLTQRRHGAIILHVILAVYSFTAIAIVCTEYFLPTIRCICEDLNLSEDVAAATFMSTATSSPELFTNIIGTFVTESDIGIGHVMGNAYYDMFFVAGLGGLVASRSIQLDWWALTRDCSFYAVVAGTLTVVVWDGQVTTCETLILLFLYFLYFTLMFNNRRIMGLLGVKNKNVESKTESDDINSQRDEIIELNSAPARAEVEINTRKQPSGTSGRGWLYELRTWLIQPLLWLTCLTLPNVKEQGQRKYYPVTFLLCIVWIGCTTYLGTWMVSVVGETFGVPDSIMGMVFMAAGGSMVEAYAVFVKSRKGDGGIGLSNSMGCNNLDATMCLALPWLIKTLIHSDNICNPSSAIQIQSPGLRFNCILLVVSVILLYFIFTLNKFKLNKLIGVVCMMSYVLVLSVAIYIEWNGIG